MKYLRKFNDVSDKKFESSEHFSLTDTFNEAVKTECQTKGAIYNTKISDDKIDVSVEIPFELELNEDDAKLLEDNIHNALELVLKPYFIKKDK